MFNLNTESTVVDIGSNDGVFLKPLKELGINVVGVEPAANLAELCNKNDIYTINDFFNKNVVSKIIEKFGKVSLVTASNVFAHSDNIDEIVEGVSELLNENGSFIVEVQYFLKTIKDLTFDNIYHEHVNYWTTTSLIKFFERFNLFVNHVEEIDTHGGSIRVFVGKTKNQNNSVSEFLNEENQFGINTNEVYKKFNSDINKIKNNVLTNFSKLKQKYNKIVGYGSPAKATTALNFYGIDTNFLDFIVEDNKLKVDKIIPGVKLPITNIEKLYEEKPDVVVVLAWNFFDEIIKNHNQLIVDGVKFISIRDLQKENFL
jgi:hypothetical protein